MVSAPYWAIRSFQRDVISPMASSQEMGANSPDPLAPVRRRGVRMRWGLLMASGRLRSLAHTQPSV